MLWTVTPYGHKHFNSVTLGMTAVCRVSPLLWSISTIIVWIAMKCCTDIIGANSIILLTFVIL